MTNTEGKGHKDGGYGLGWVVIPEKQDFGSCYHQSETVFHSGMFLSLHTSHLDVIDQTQKTVFDHTSKTPRRELKIQRVVEYFLPNFEVFGNMVKRCLECLLYLLNQNQTKEKTKN